MSDHQKSRTVEEEIEKSLAETLGEGREIVGPPSDLYADLVRVHVENGVLLYFIIMLFVASIICLVAIPFVSVRDIYVTPGPVDSGIAKVNWGMTISAEARAEYEAVAQKRREKLEQQQARVGAVGEQETSGDTVNLDGVEKIEE